MSSKAAKQAFSQSILEHNETIHLKALAIAAADLSNWKQVPASEPDPEDFEIEQVLLWDAVDTEILALVDMVPPALSWRVLTICEALITPKTETAEHLALMAELIALAPLSLYQEANAHLWTLMSIANRHVATVNGLGDDKPRFWVPGKARWGHSS